jgi:hypothetical protein
MPLDSEIISRNFMYERTEITCARKIENSLAVGLEDGKMQE